MNIKENTKQQKREEIRNQNGITLLVLVITIIILLILAGITIGALTGKNGIINNSKNAKEETEIANEKEIIEKATVQAMGSNKQGNIEESELQNALNKETGEGKTEATDVGEEFEVVFKGSNRYYIVDKYGNVGEAQEYIKDKYPGDITVGKDGEKLNGDTEETTYQIWCIEDLVAFSKNVNEGNKYGDKYIKLMRDLDFNSKNSYTDWNTKDYDIYLNGDGNKAIREQLSSNGNGFKTIGIDNQNQFWGDFDGNHYSINNLYINGERFFWRDTRSNYKKCIYRRQSSKGKRCRRFNIYSW